MDALLQLVLQRKQRDLTNVDTVPVGIDGERRRGNRQPYTRHTQHETGDAENPRTLATPVAAELRLIAVCRHQAAQRYRKVLRGPVQPEPRRPRLNPRVG